MDFQTYHTAVVAHSMAYSGVATHGRRARRQLARVDLHGKQARQMTAAAALVVDDRGVEWCRRHPREFREAIFRKLGFWANLALGLLGLFTGGGVWLTLARILIPAVLSFLSDRSAGIVFGAGSDNTLPTEALEILKG